MNFQGQKSTSNSHLYLSRKNILVYLKSQGYNRDAHESITMAEIAAMNSNGPSNLDFEVQHTTDESLKCSVFYYLKQNQSIKQSVLEDLVMNYYEENDKLKEDDGNKKMLEIQAVKLSKKYEFINDEIKWAMKIILWYEQNNRNIPDPYQIKKMVATFQLKSSDDKEHHAYKLAEKIFVRNIIARED